METLKYAYLLAKSVTLVPSHCERTNQVMMRNRRIGLSMSGIIDAIEKFGKRKFLNEFCDKGYECIKKLDKMYSSWLCIPNSIKISSIKPSGCRPANALVTTDKGIFTLEELMRDHPLEEEWNDISDDISAIQDNSNNRITKSYRNGKSKTIKIKTNYNIEVESTPNHMWFVKEHINRSDEKGEYKRIPINDWKRADELNLNDVLDINIDSYSKKDPYKFNSIKNPSTICGDRGTVITQPSEMNNDIAWLLGYLWGDGSLSPNMYRIRFMDQNIYNLEKAQRVLQEYFNLYNPIHKSSGDKDASVLEIGSRFLWDWIKENDLFKYSLDGHLHVPLPIRCSTKEHIISFIAGIVDSDGCVHSQNNKKGLTITTADEIFAKEIQEIALTVGLVFGRSHNIGGKNLQKEKSIWLMALANNTLESSFNILVENSNKCQNVLNEISEWSCLNGAQNTWVLGKIIGVEESEEEIETFDVEVENEHWYYSGAIKSHNSVSLLPGVSPGIHFPHSEYYIRRVEIQKNNPLIEVLEEAGYKKEQSYYKKNSWVFEFPVKTENFYKSKNDVTIWEQMELNVLMQYYWSDNNVSQTVTFKPEEAKDIKSVLETFEDRIKTVSFLPNMDHNYQQAPYEEITKEQYEKMIKNIKPLKLEGIQTSTEEDREKLKYCDGDNCTI